jgi:hypothetical protein
VHLVGELIQCRTIFVWLKSIIERSRSVLYLVGELYECRGGERSRSGEYLSGTIIRGTLKTPNSQLVTPISIKLQRPDGCD